MQDLHSFLVLAVCECTVPFLGHRHAHHLTTLGTYNLPTRLSVASGKRARVLVSLDELLLEFSNLQGTLPRPHGRVHIRRCAA